MDNNNDIVHHNEPAMASTSGVKYQNISRRSSSSSSSSSMSSSSSSSQSPRDSKKKKKRSSRHHSKKRKRDRRILEKLSKEVNELRKNMISYDNRNHVDNNDVSSDVSRDLYDDVSVDASQALSYNCNLDTEVIPHLSFNIETKLKDPAVPPAPQEYLKMLNEIQRFDKNTWSDIRYADTQKFYNHSPGFTELETNEEVKAYDNTRHLAYSDKSYAAITFCVLKQKEAVLNSLRNLLAWSKSPDASLVNINDKIEELFLKGEFHKVSSDLLQMTCGHRAETIEMRRDSILKGVRDPLVKVALNKIPPSNSHIFSSEAFTAALDKAGGVRKAFWPVKQSNNGNAAKAKPGVSVRHPSQGHACHYVPSRGTSGYCCEPAPAAHTHCHQNQPSQGGHQYHYTSKGHNNTNRGHSHNPNNRASSFRTRGSRSRYPNERGQKRPFSPSCNKGNKKQKQ